MSRDQRHLRSHPCPVCGGAEQDPRGLGKRCTGFTSGDGEWCHCSREELAGSIDQNGAGLFAHKMHGSCNCGTSHGPDLRVVRDEIEATYDYRDEGGELLYQVVRKVGKQFLQRRPDGAGGWIWKLEGVRRVLYRLPELIDDDGDRPVYIVEGEKDADALAKRGFIATCNSGGAGKWRSVAEGAAKVLAGRDVVIIADRDKPGEDHARDVHAHLRGIAHSVRLMQAPAPHKDVYDLFAAGGTLEELVPLAEHEPEPSDEPEGWRERLITAADKSGKLRTLPKLANLVTILRFHPEWHGVLGFDTFAERLITTKPPPWDVAVAPETKRIGEWRETDYTRVVDWLARNEGIHVHTKLVAEAVHCVAESHEVHPVRDYLSRLKWDGVERLSTILSTYAGAADTDYTRAIGTRWMISAVARVMRPGCQVDCVLVAEGPQGTLKSSFFRSLVPDPFLYTETGVTIGDKDSYQALHGVWLFMFDELDSLKRGDITKVKNFISAMKDHYRPSYGRIVRDFLRQNVFAGSTNETDYLIDRTGNRRIWPFRVAAKIDLESLKRDRDQLWAEALHRFNAGEAWHVDTPELRKLCEGEQSARVHADPWEQLVAAWIREPTHEVEEEGEHGLRRHRMPFRMHPNGPSTAEVLQHALRCRPDAIERTKSMRAAEVMKALGYTEVTRPDNEDGSAGPRRYRKPPTTLQPKETRLEP